MALREGILQTSTDVTSGPRTLLIGICSPCFQLGDLGGTLSTGAGHSPDAGLSAPKDLGKCCPGECTFWAGDTPLELPKEEADAGFPAPREPLPEGARRGPRPLDAFRLSS